MTAAIQEAVVGNTATPFDQGGVVEALRAAYEAPRAIYPVGGGTSLDYGNAPARAGEQLELSGLNRIVDYTPRDMTILVEAGVRMAELAATLAAEGQHLPIDVPRAGEATIGGVVATNWNGPRRYGHGTIRDYVIGIHAVDGRGVPFKGGGRVVKNVAGYDFCKLLTGSLGTLGVVTQLALKVKPQPEQSAAILATCSDLQAADAMLARLIHLPAPPVAVDLLVGRGWEADSAIRNPQGEIRNQTASLSIRVEGTESEVAWLAQKVQDELRKAGGESVQQLSAAEADSLWARQVEFSDRGAGDETDGSPFVVKIAVPPSGVSRMIGELLACDPNCTIQAHAANGVVVARFAEFRQSDVTPLLVGKLRPLAIQLGGSLVVMSSKLEGLTPHLIWGGRTAAIMLLERVKQKFDPRRILNPGQFVF
jgi:glycolate oxidase FAD binding subunit